MVSLKSYLNSEDDLKAAANNISHHIHLNKDVWAFTMWNKKDVTINPKNVMNENDKLLKEYWNDLVNDSCKSPVPKKFEAMDNVILLQGIKESIDRDIGTSSTQLDYISLGSSATAEVESQTDLQSEFTDTAYSRLRCSTSGSRQRVNQTMKLGGLFDSTRFDTTPKTIREAGIHWGATGTLKCHARVVSTAFIMDPGDLFVVQVNELQENGSL